MARRQRSQLKEVTRRLRSVELFAPLRDDELRRVASAGRIGRLGRGHELFRKGDPPDQVHLILNGSVEVLRPTPTHPDPTPVAYLRAGELVGDMALLTGTPRRSLGRVPEQATVWTLEREQFETLTHAIPGYGLALAKVFAHRLEDFITYLRRQGPAEGMAGRLEHFDLPTVLQTLVSARQSGVLAVANDRGRNVAQVLLIGGLIARARCGHLEGEDAFCELFLKDEPGEFYFQTMHEPDPGAISKVAIEQPAMSLLMEAMRLVDEVRRFKGRLPPADTPLSRVSTTVPWSDEGTADAAKALLQALDEPRPLRDVVREIPHPTRVLYDVAVRLHEAGHIQ